MGGPVFAKLAVNHVLHSDVTSLRVSGPIFSEAHLSIGTHLFSCIDPNLETSVYGRGYCFEFRLEWNHVQ